jgi:hypothetical protein
VKGAAVQHNIRPEITKLAISLESVTPHPRNVRQGDVGAICQSLEAHGQYRPIVVHKSTNHILAGNHTYAAATALGWKKIAATFVDCDDEQALRILLVDNRANDLAIYDDHALAELLQELSAGEGLAGTLFDGDDLDDLLFRISGTLGTGHPTLSATDALEGYEGRDTKSIVLPYSTAEYRELMEKLAALRNRLGIDTNAELIAALINDSHAKS